MLRVMVRTFTRDDLSAILAIQQKCPGTAQWRDEDYLRLAGDPGGSILVAQTEGATPPAVAGYAAFHCLGDEAELRNLAVNPSQQRRGIARALLTAGMRALQELGVRQLFLEVRATNQPAVALYQSLGFRLLDTRRNYYQNPADDALVMTRRI
jgi:[ribosomal protein S18]-alanine N-acetyltransferase